MNTESRQSFLGANQEEVLASKTAGIVGVCGGGSHIAQQLAHVGIGHYVIADKDVVEDTNLNRMVGSRPKDAEIAEKKSAVISRLIGQIKSDAKIEAIDCNWTTGHELFKKCDVIFGCVDSFQERDNLERFCRHNSILYIDIGMDVHSVSHGYQISGQVIVSKPGGICMRCLGFLTDDVLAVEQAKYGDAGYKPQVIWPNGVLASIAVGQFIGSILPWHGDHNITEMIEFDGNRQVAFESNKLPYLKQRQCPHW